MLSLCPPPPPTPWKGAPAVHKEVPLRPRGGPRGNQLRGGTSLGRYAQKFHLPPKLFSPGRLRLAALEAGFSSLRRK